MYKTLVNRLKSKKRGFTLIELIVVIAILGILAAILVPSMLGIVRDSRDQVNITTARSIYSAAHQVYTSMTLRNEQPAADATIDSDDDEDFVDLVDENLGDGFTGSYSVTFSATGVASVQFNPANAGRFATYSPANGGLAWAEGETPAP